LVSGRLRRSVSISKVATRFARRETSFHHSAFHPCSPCLLQQY
jgi:hypothetical protein